MKTQKVRIVIYKAKDGYRWHMKRCGRIVAESGEGYVRCRSCVTSVNNLVSAITKFNYEWSHLEQAAKLHSKLAPQAK